MNPREKLAFPILFILSACGGSQEPARSAESSLDALLAAPAAPPPAAPEDRADAACNHWRNDVHRKLVEGIPGAVEQLGSSLIGVGQCHYAKTGIWITGLTSATASKGSDGKVQIRGRWQIVYFDRATGADVKLVPSAGDARDAAPGEENFRGGERELWMTSSPYDFDGDGVNELVVSWSQSELGKRADDRTKIFAFRDGAVVPFETGTKEPIFIVDDKNGDGRPDLVVKAFSAQDPCASSNRLHTDADFVGISDPKGSFSFSHPDALARLRKACPSAPVSLTPPPTDGEFAFRLYTNVACARVWGKPEAEVVSGIDAALASGHPGIESCSVSREDLVRWAKVTPLQTLR